MREIITAIVFLLLVTLIGCNSPNSVLSIPHPDNKVTSSFIHEPTASIASPQSSIDKTHQNALQIGPIVGAPLSVITRLSHELIVNAKIKDVTLLGLNPEEVASILPSATYIMKGYFSALIEGNQTIIIYVWDILDPTGQRHHRIQGQDKIVGRTPDPWSVVPAATIETIANKTIQDYIAWLSKKQT